MDDTLQADKTARELGELLQDHNGKDVAVLDLRELNSWTDFFIIATVTSQTHVQGLLRHIREFAGEKDLEILHRRRKAEPDTEWNLVDMGNIVVHLMSERARSFYELERLWT
ncbi:MAG: ribosome silencing factor [Treponema sp.]|jgi:ribosome-associated protein|nr:ribosome silencing factor [Treponema sp.]